MYYPNADEDNSEFILEYGRFRLNYLSELTFEDFAIRTLELENVEVGENTLRIFFFFFSILFNFIILISSKKKNAPCTIVTTRIGLTLASPNTQRHFLIS